MRVTIDTNILVYALDTRDPSKQATSLSLIETLRSKDCRLSLQVCGELYAALTRRLKRAPWEAAQAARNILAAFESFGPTKEAVERALAEAMAGRFGYRDALLLSSAHQAGCVHCFSEDMAEGARLGGVEVVQPFAARGLSRRAREILAAA